MKKRPTYNPPAIIKSGNQTAEPLAMTDYVVVQSKPDGGIILRDTKTGRRELWQHKQDFAGYVIRIGRKHYEFMSGIAEA